MKKIQALLIVILALSSLGSAQAVDLREVSYSTVPAEWHPLYGLAESVEIIPLRQTLDEKITLSFSKKNIPIPRKDFYRNHLGIFHSEEAFNSERIFSGQGKSDGDVLLLEVDRTGHYFLAPIIAEEDFNLQTSSNTGIAGKPIEITSSTIVANDGQPIWDGFPFIISTSNATISGTSVSGNEVKTAGGKVRFTLTPTVNGPIAVALTTDFGDAGANAVYGQEVVANNTATVSNPPEAPVPAPEITLTPEDSETLATPVALIADEPSPGQPYFPDITNHWAKEFIEILAERGIINGYANGNFGPNDPVTRAQLVKIALNAFDYALDDVSEKPFKDVETHEWFAPFITTAKLEKLLDGYTDGSFRPNQVVNRAEGLKIIMSAAGVSLNTDDRADFSDVDQAAWFAPFVNTAVSMGIIQGREQVVEVKKSTVPGGVIFIKENLWPGKTGVEVEKLQTALTILGHYKGQISGTYDRETLEAVYAFQVAAGIVKTPLDPSRNGSLGEKTRNIFNAKKVSAAPATEKAAETKTLRFFDPLLSLTRAEVAKIVVKMVEMKTNTQSSANEPLPGDIQCVIAPCP